MDRFFAKYLEKNYPKEIWSLSNLHYFGNFPNLKENGINFK